MAEVLAYLGLEKKYKPSANRKAGQTAYLRTRLDPSGLSVIWDWLDSKGKWVPYSYIDFNTPNGQPDRKIIAHAYRQADKAWFKAYDDWNYRLSVYLSRKAIWDDCHVHAWSPRREEQPAYTADHFLKAPQILKSMDKIISHLQQVDLLADHTALSTPHGRRLFRKPDPPAHRENGGPE